MLPFCCEYMIVTEQKARTTYDNILRLVDDPDVKDPIKYLREREIVHYQRFADTNHTLSNRFLSVEEMKTKKQEPIFRSAKLAVKL